MATAPPAGTIIRRHRLATRVWHWVNAVAMFILLGSGLMILNAHPQLYWGQYGANFDQPWFRVGWLFEGNRVPGWLTIPSVYNLAAARQWHLLFALVLGFGLLGYMIVSLFNRHFGRDLALRRGELAPAHLAEDVRDHLAFRFHDRDDPGRYNTLQKLSYIAVIFILIPLVIATGLTMSPNLNAAWPWLLDLFGGRQSARSIHFLAAMGLALFTVVHLTLVILAGVGNEVRSIVTGKWRVPENSA
jgi:Ni/Fe-hydrogenase b-type cytochrome subunit